MRDGSVELRDGPELDAIIWSDVSPSATVAMVGDLDGDGLADFALGEPALGRVRVLFGAVGGVSREHALHGDPVEGFGAAVAGVDLDGDDRSELVIASPRRARAGLLGSIAIHRDLALPPAYELYGFRGLGESLERAFDVDGDGLGDLLVRDGPSAWVLGRDAGGLRVIDLFTVQRSPVALGDVDGDDHADLTWPFAELAHDEVVTAAGDVNGDMVADVLITRGDASRLVLGAAHAQAPREIWTGTRAFPIGDVDADGLADIASIVDGTIAIRRGRLELFGPIATIVQPRSDATPPARPRVALAAGPDLDGDGRRGDLLIGLADLDGSAGGILRVDSGVVALLPASEDPSVAALVTREPPLHGGIHDERYGAALATGLAGLYPAVLVGAPGFDGVDPEFFDPHFDPALISATSEPGFVPGEDGGRVELEAWSTTRAQVSMHAGPHPAAALGASLAMLGDLDGDGSGEVAWAAPGFSPDVATTGAGLVMVMRLHRVNVSAADFLVRGGWRIDGTRPGEALGVLAALGDVDGDTRADFAIGSPAVGEVQIVGGTSFPDGPAGPPPKGARRVLIDPRPGAAARFGAAIAAGDFDGDARDDIAVAAPLDARIEVFFAGESRTTITLAGGDAATPDPMLTLAACDVDGDAYAELIVGRPEWSGDSSGQGRVEVFRGGPDGLSPAPAWTLTGGYAGAHFGLALAPLDRNGDGLCDLAIAGLDQGRAQVSIVLGNDGARGRGLALTVLDAFERRAVEPWALVGQRDLAVTRLGPGAPFPGRHLVELEARPSLRSSAGVFRAEIERHSARPVELTAGGLLPSSAYRIRARIRYPSAAAPLQPTSRWVRANVTTPGPVDFRTRENSAPLARPDRYRIAGGETRIPVDWLLDNDYDLDLDPLTIDLVTDARAGTVTLEGDTIVYRPDAPTAREDGFEYRLRDRFGATSALTPVTLVVTPCELDACRAGLVQGTFALPTGARAGFRCKVRRDVYPPRVECPVEPDGTLSLSSPATCP